MKVIHFIASIDKSAGGTTAYMQLLSKELIKNIEIRIATGFTPNPIFIEGVKVDFFKTSLVYWFKMQVAFEKYLISQKPNLVHINGIWTPQNWLFQKVTQKLGIQVILSPHGMLEPYILKRHSLKKKIALALYQHKALKNANYFHTTAVAEKNTVINLGYSQPISIVPNGIDLSEIAFKVDWNTSSERTNFLFLSRIHPQKGLELLIDAVALLNSDKLLITIAGEGEQAYINLLKNKIKAKGVDPNFNFIGGIYGKAKWELYKNSDIFLLPTFSENFGIVVTEALATGIPVITTTGTPWEELNTTNCGWWIDLSVENLKSTLQKAMQKSPEELKVMGLNGRKLVLDNYDIKAVGVKMKNLYSKIIDKN